MENAAKALTIAGAILIALLIVSITIYNLNKIRGTAEVYSQHFDAIELEKYNGAFDTFDGRKNITAQEIITIASFAKEKNVGTSVYVDNDDITNYTESQKRVFLFLSSNPMKYEQDSSLNLIVKNLYTCNEINYDDDGKVIEIKFKKN